MQKSSKLTNEEDFFLANFEEYLENLFILKYIYF